jgi:two-component system sensor histidine kinase/response regulator
VPATAEPQPVAAAPANHGISELPPLPGIDVAAGLIYANGKIPLYLKLLKMFHDKYGSDFGVTMQQSISLQDWANTELQAHSMKGMAGTLGARALQEKAGVLETAIKHHQYERMNWLLQDVLTELEVVLGGIEQLQQRGAELEKPLTQPAIAPAMAAPRLEAFLQLLQQRDTEAISQFTDIRAMISGWPSAGDTLKKLEGAISRLDFASAQALIREIAHQAGVGLKQPS